MVDTVSTQHPSQSAPWWMGAIAGVAAAAVALAFGQFIEGVSDTMPGLVLGVGELIIDYTPSINWPNASATAAAATPESAPIHQGADCDGCRVLTMSTMPSCAGGGNDLAAEMALVRAR
ncbi:MAG: hypothetical protein EBZ17_11265 [Actinobacteria bacterium]|nr:hypothetical protein [Actinomycetota bacterium]